MTFVLAIQRGEDDQTLAARLESAAQSRDESGVEGFVDDLI